MSRTMAGEQVIKALDMRLSKVRSTTSELEKVGTFYTGIIELCVSNPPKDNRHLRALEEQVRPCIVRMNASTKRYSACEWNARYFIHKPSRCEDNEAMLFGEVFATSANILRGNGRGLVSKFYEVKFEVFSSYRSSPGRCVVYIQYPMIQPDLYPQLCTHR